MGCPNLPVDHTKPDGEKGVIFVAVKGQGAFQVRSRRISLISPHIDTTLRTAIVDVIDVDAHHHVVSHLPRLSLLLRIGRSSSFRSFHQRSHRQITRHHQAERPHGLAGEVLLDRARRWRRLLASARFGIVRRENLGPSLVASSLKLLLITTNVGPLIRIAPRRRSRRNRQRHERKAIRFLSRSNVAGKQGGRRCSSGCARCGDQGRLAGDQGE